MSSISRPLSSLVDKSPADQSHFRPRAKRRRHGHKTQPDAPKPDGLKPDGRKQPDDAAVLKSKNDSDTSEVETGGNKMVTDYVAFLKSLSAENGGEGPNIDDFMAQAEHVAEVVTGNKDISQDDIASVSFNSQVTHAEAAYVNYSQGPNGRSLQAGAAVSDSASVSEEIVLKDGTHITVQASVQVTASVSVTMEQAAELTQKGDPLALDLNGDGDISLTDFTNGALFDLNADGGADQAAFVTGGDVFLALDKNRNGDIDNGTELFGDQNGAANGFEELGRYDDDKNGEINDKDSIYGSLLGLRLDANGVVQKYSLAALGVKSIGLSYQNTDLKAQGGNEISQLGTFERSDGSQGLAADVLLNFRKAA